MPRTYYHWVKPGFVLQTMNADWYACVKENSSQSTVIAAGTSVEVVHADRVDDGMAVQCMKARGYTLTGTDNNPS
jgi:hypothetical protein